MFKKSAVILSHENHWTAWNWSVTGQSPTWRPSRFPSGFALGKFSRVLGNLLVVGDGFPNTSLLSAVYVYNMKGGRSPVKVSWNEVRYNNMKGWQVTCRRSRSFPILSYIVDHPSITELEFSCLQGFWLETFGRFESLNTWLLPRPGIWAVNQGIMQGGHATAKSSVHE